MRNLKESYHSVVHITLNAFLQNSKNKTRLISLIKEVLLGRKSGILKLLKNQRICISTYKVCEYLDQHVIIKSHSGDDDLNVLLTSLITD